MNEKHTAGPWQAKMNESSDIVISGDYKRAKYGGEVGDLICTVTCGLNSTQAANACLIAAAPELLEAAKNTVNRHCDGSVGKMLKDGTLEQGEEHAALCVLAWLRERDKEAEDAIAKADGGREHEVFHN